ncbi:MAG: hypothetical protein RMJ33_07855 [Saprospiraceae bacterium]|nr:hypothetical protein [Saprospiraceae bacterium]MDW8229738.1 hypothetical protein [Saprospiraceae bacterium]
MLRPKSARMVCACVSALWYALACGSCGNDAPPPPPVPMTIDTLTGDVAPAPNPWKDNGCALVTDQEVIALFQIDVKRDLFNTRSLPGQAFCLRYWMKPNWREIERANEQPGAEYREFKNTLVVQVIDYGRQLIARQQFDLLRNRQRQTYETDVAGLGDDALWSTSSTSLVIKKGHLLVKITLDYTDDPRNNLPYAKKIAELALQKMP